MVRYSSALPGHYRNTVAFWLLLVLLLLVLLLGLLQLMRFLAVWQVG